MLQCGKQTTSENDDTATNDPTVFHSTSLFVALDVRSMYSIENIVGRIDRTKKIEKVFWRHFF